MPSYHSRAAPPPLSPRAAAAAEAKRRAAATSHDRFNLLAIGILNLLNFLYLAAGSSQAFAALWAATGLYFILDTAFLFSTPGSVRSPGVILGHHLVSAAFLWLPFKFPHTRKYLAVCMLVEVNTWLLIAKRTLPFKVRWPRA